jgi:hypothetical protein
MPEERSPRQTTIFGTLQDARADSAGRMRWLGGACRLIGGAQGDSLRLLVLVVYLRTCDGLGAWVPQEDWKSFVDDPWGPQCKRSKAKQMICQATSSGILTKSPQGAYQIDWSRVRDLYGLWLQVRSASAPADAPSAPADAPSAPADAPSAPADGDASTGYGMGSSRTRGRCLLDLTCLVDDDKSNQRWPQVLKTARAIIASAFPGGRSKRLDPLEQQFVLSVAMLATTHSDAHDFSGWLTGSLKVVRRKHPLNPLGYLRVTLANNLSEHLGLCPAHEARWHFGQMLATIRPFVQRHYREPESVTRAVGAAGAER